MKFLDNFKERMQNSLGDEWLICKEEKVDYNSKKKLAIIKNYQSTNYKSSILFNLSIEVLTNQVEQTMDELINWTWEQNETKFALEPFNYVRQLVTQPANNSNFVQAHTNYIGTLVFNITLIASVNLLDIKTIYIDNELIDPTQISISYNTKPNNQRNNNEELNSSTINESNIQLQVVYPNDNTNFAKKVRNIEWGILNKNTDFNISITYTDDVNYNLTFKLSSMAENAQRGVLTTTTATLIH